MLGESRGFRQTLNPMNEPEISCDNFTSSDGNPEGGRVTGCGIAIDWQNGPLAGPGGNEIPRNGAFVEEVLEAAKQRLEYYQTTKFKCLENEEAIEFICQALGSIHKRLTRRKSDGIAGTHQPDPEPQKAA